MQLATLIYIFASLAPGLVLGIATAPIDTISSAVEETNLISADADFHLWPDVAQTDYRSLRLATVGSDMTNGERIRRGLSLNKPVMKKRLDSPPAQAQPSGSSSVYNFLFCTDDGFGINAEHDYPAATVNEAVRICAAFNTADNAPSGQFALLQATADVFICYTGTSGNPSQTACSADNYALYKKAT